MTIDTAQSVTLLVIAFLAIAILLRILVYVHKQTRRVKELELRMKAYEMKHGELEASQSNVTYNEPKGD